MATLIMGTNVVKLAGDGLSSEVVLYALRKVTAGDTIDLSVDFNPPIAAALIGTAGAAAGTSAVVTTFAGNVLTIPAGPSNSAGVMVVWGVHA